MAERDPAPPPRVRLDLWLWRARVAKTRGLSAKLIRSGHVRVNGSKEKAPGRGLLVGDVLTIAVGQTVRVLEVLDFGERRGPAAEAQLLYREQDRAATQRREIPER